jgi:hypothetical protein
MCCTALYHMNCNTYIPHEPDDFSQRGKEAKIADRRTTSPAGMLGRLPTPAYPVAGGVESGESSSSSPSEKRNLKNGEGPGTLFYPMKYPTINLRMLVFLHVSCHPAVPG